MGSLPRMPQMGVYAITHSPTGQQYIGASIDIAKRWQGHRAALLLAHLRRRKWPQAPRKHRHHG